MWLRRKFLGSIVWAMVGGVALGGEALADDETWPAGAQETDVRAALEAMNEWIASYQREDYASQWRLTDSRIRRWFDRRRWTRGVERSRRRSGALLSYSIRSYAPVSSAQLPCTELGHCFRERVPYVVAVLDTRYEAAEPPQPEYCVMARSDEGWRFGGGTILNRPLGETAVIMTRADERRYEPSQQITIRQ